MAGLIPPIYNTLSGAAMLSKLERIIILLNQNNTQRVDLAGTKLSESDVKKLSVALIKNSSLKELILGGIVFGCQIKDEGMKHIASMLEQNTTLNYLDLRSNELTEQGIDTLFKALEKNNGLKFLDIRSNLINNKDEQPLAFLKTIENKSDLKIIFDKD